MTAHDFLYGFSRYYRTKSDWHLDLDFARDIPVPGRRTSGNDVYDGIVSDATVLDAKLLSRSGRAPGARQSSGAMRSISCAPRPGAGNRKNR